MDEMARRRPGKRTRIFDSEGMIDEVQLAEYNGVLQTMAAQYDDGLVPQEEFMAMLEKKDTLDKLTRKQWESFFRLLGRAGQDKAISSKDFEGLYRNTFLPEMFEKFADIETMAVLTKNYIRTY